MYVGHCPSAHLAEVTTVVADRFASILPEVSQSAVCLFDAFPAPQDGQITALLDNPGNRVSFSTSEFKVSTFFNTPVQSSIQFQSQSLEACTQGLIYRLRNREMMDGAKENF